MSIMRRTDREVAVVTPVIRVGELEIDILDRRVRIEGRDLHLTPLELSLLFLLAANAGRVLTRQEILEHVWDSHAAESNVVDRQVRKLRAKLQDDWHRPRYIATVLGKGYQFVLTSEDQTTVPPP
jgi:two-component system, OmpR family, KDP operon response regulator KdpE